MPDRSGVLAAIGMTPVVRLSRVVEPGMAEVWVKLESYNPTGSYKDRMALAMIEGAERAGKLRPGQPVVEYTGGSTGSSLALVCSIKGYPLRIVSSDAFAPAKVRTMRAFGAAGTHRIEGGGTGFVPPQLSTDEIDEVIAVSTADASAMARRAAREDGIWSGPSTGANITAALSVARRLGAGRRVATIQVDSGLKYLAGEIYS